MSVFPPAPKEAGLTDLEVREREARLVYHAIFAQNKVSEVGAQTIRQHVERNGDMPVNGVRRYRRDWVVEKRCDAEIESSGRPEGAVIMEFSYRARNRLLFWAKNCDVDFKSMLTITYPSEFPRNGREVKTDLRLFIQWLKRKFSGIRGLWFLEFQRRGAPHFHLLLSLDLWSKGELTEKRRTRRHKSHGSDSYRTHQGIEDLGSRAWYRTVGSGDEKHLRAGVCWEHLESTEAAIRYAAKHAAKPHQKSVPEEYENVGRFWGKFGGVNLVGGEELELVTTEELARIVGCDVVSSKGRIKKYIYDANEIETA